MGVSRGFHGCFTAVFKNFEKEGVNFCRFRPLKSEGSGFPMTDMEKRTILTMRKNGNSYAAIAKELNIPVGTIKTISRGESTRILIQCLPKSTDYLWIVFSGKEVEVCPL